MTGGLLVLKLAEGLLWRQFSRGLLCMQRSLAEGPVKHTACFYLTPATRSASVVFASLTSHTHTQPAALAASS